MKGWLFLIPFLIGVTFFFLIPVIRSLLFSFSEITYDSNGYILDLIGLKPYKQALLEHTEYRQTVVQAFLKMLMTAPLCLMFSFFMASLLNQNFRGKTMFRVILFLPAIVTTLKSSNALESSMNGFSGYKDTFSDAAVHFTQQISDYLTSVGVSQSISGSITGLADQLYNVINISSIQILILLVGMQAISPALYEAAKVEGANSWEVFWKITFPMISPLLLTCAVYTVIDSFTSQGNSVLKMIQTTSLTQMDMAQGAAMAWIYFMTITVMLAIVWFIFSKFISYEN